MVRFQEAGCVVHNHSFSGILKVTHDVALTDVEILGALNAVEVLLKDGGTAIVFLDPVGICRWTGILEECSNLYLDQWLHVSVWAVLVLCVWYIDMLS